MNNFDRMLSSEDVMRRRATLLQRMHIDGVLLILLLPVLGLIIWAIAGPRGNVRF